MIYYAVFTNKNKEPEAIFKHKRIAEKYLNNEKYVWSGMPGLKLSMREIEIPSPNRKKLVVIHKITWIDYVSHGFGLLLNSIKTHAKERYAGFFRKS